MKKFSLIILICIIALSSFVFGAVADGVQDTNPYLKVTSTNTVFYDKDNPEVPLFTLTKDCYVKVLSNADASNKYRVEYNGLQGYVSASEFTESAVTGLVNPYHYPVHIKATTATKFLRYPGELIPDSSATSVSVNDTLILMGTYSVSGNTYLYVLHDMQNTFGCILASNTDWDPTLDTLSPHQYPFGEPQAPVIPEQKPGDQDNTNHNTVVEPSNNLVRVLLIIGICIPALIIVFLIFKPVRPDTGRYATDTPKRRVQDYDDFDD